VEQVSRTIDHYKLFTNRFRSKPRIWEYERKSEMEQLVLGKESLSLLDQIVSMDNLVLAYKSVRKNNGAPGIDGVTVDEYGKTLPQELRQLRQEVLGWTYKPSPVKRVKIPKPGNQGVRLLGIPRVHDRVLHAAIKQVLEPILDPQFSENSFGFRPGRNQQQAITRAKEIVNSGKKFIVDIDLSKFFDRINHDLLINRLGQQISDKRVLRLIGLILRSGIMENGLVQTNSEGSVQGSPLSPLLSNVVLDELDKELESRGHVFCRYADDCNVFVQSERAGQRTMKSLTKFIERKLKLKVNEEKSQVALSKFVKFLGYTIVGTAIAISAKSMDRAYEKIKELIPRRGHLNIEKTVDGINKWYVGWSNYYRISQYTRQFSNLEAHIRRRLRAQLVAHHKRRRFLYKKLRKRGVSHGYARHVYKCKRTWALSITPAVHRAWPNKWFHETMELYTVLDERQPHWFKTSVIPHLT
jgi:RNA-directed DNA polymerase